jgi:glycine/D-amino acid oxidase-like deaminating enzyme
VAALKEIIVIGAGIIGASIAWHLARAGARVAMLEAAAPGGVATPCSFGWINASWGNPEPYFRLRTRSMAEWQRLKAEVPDLPLAWCGGLLWDMPPAELEAYAKAHASWGYGIRTIGRAEIARLEPNLADMPELAVHVAAEGVAEPAPTARLLATEAQRLGARLATGTRALALGRKGSRVSVETGEGPIEADGIVIAAGTATAALAETAGIRVPLKHSPGLLVHSKPCRRLLNGLVMGEAAHIRQTDDGRLVAGADFGGTEVGDDAEKAAAETFADMKGMLTGADGLELDFHTVGFRPMPEDGFPIVGHAAECVYIAVMHSGVTLAPAVGRFASEEILDGSEAALLAPYRPQRFA